MLGTRGITRGRTNSLVFLANELLVGEVFVSCITPKISADPRMQALGKAFRKTVGQCLEHNAGVIVVGLLKSLLVLFDAQAACDSKHANIVGYAGLARSDVVGQAFIVDTLALDRLLAQVPPCKQYLGPGLVPVHLDIFVVDAVGGVKGKD